MIDIDPTLRGHYEHFKAAQADRAAALSRINGRQERLASLPAPLNIAINLAQLVGLEYEYQPKDMRAVSQAENLIWSYTDSIKNRLTRIPGRHPISRVIYHPNDAREHSNAQPWEVNFSAQVGADRFYVGLRTKRFQAQRSRDGKAVVEIQGEEAPALLYLPEGYEVGVCVERAWDCIDDSYPCRTNDWVVTKLPRKAREFTPPTF